MPSLETGKRIYALWARHLGAYTLMARAVLLGRDRELRDPLAVFVPTTNWNVAVDLIATMRDVFGNVRGAKLNRGSAFLVVSRKNAAGTAEASE